MGRKLTGELCEEGNGWAGYCLPHIVYSDGYVTFLLKMTSRKDAIRCRKLALLSI